MSTPTDNAYLKAALLAKIHDTLCELHPARRAEWSAIRPHTELHTLGLDSLEWVHVIGALEERLEVTCPDEELVKVQTIADLVVVLRGGRLR